MPVVEVAAPSRLHFGMFSFGQPEVPQFGGVGAMIRKPGLRLRIEPAERFEAVGPLAERATATTLRISQAWQLEQPPGCRLEIVEAPPEHVGLGTGTQLALSIAAGLNAFLERPPLDAEALAAATGRGARSAIGTYGFLQGGLLVEGGKRPADLLSPLEEQIILPDSWRFVVISPGRERGLAGEAEQRAFRELPPVPVATTRQLRDEVERHLLPAARRAAFAEFSRSLYRFGHLAGTCFAQRQGGPFASASIARLVERVREWGIEGVGQSSWGPAVFALLESEPAAERLAAALGEQFDVVDFLLVTAPSNHGAVVKIL